MKRGMCVCAAVVVLTCCAVFGVGCAGEAGSQGTVFEDRNANGVVDAGEAGVSGVIVSNGLAVTVTDDKGAYQLPEGGVFVFMTTPSGYEPTTPWYWSTEGSELSFGLAPSPERDAPEFCFVQMTDIHLDTEVEHLEYFEQAVDEINELAPAFVVATGDLVNGADVVDIPQAREWFEAYSSGAAGLEMPLFNAPGNHDVVGINSGEVADTETGYAEETYTGLIGPTYYSFDWGAYHCLVLDPNDIVDGRQVYRISDEQMEWLHGDLSHREGWPLLVFFHEPTPSWQNRAEALDLLGGNEAALFSGHWHQDLLLDSLGISEQVTGALCGEWWYGSCPDGRPPGYRIVSIDSDGVSSFYKGVGLDRQISVVSPDAVVGGEVKVSAQVYTEQGAVQEVSYRVDGGESVEMSIEAAGRWAAATASWDTGQVEPGYHTITCEARDEAGTFSADVELRVSHEDEVPIGDLLAHFEAHQGDQTRVSGRIEVAAIGEPYAAEGTGALVVSDESGSVVVLLAECISPPLPALGYGDTVSLTAVPIEHRWGFLASSREFGMMQQFVSFLPEGSLVEDADGAKVLRLMRVVSGDGVQVLSP